MAAVSKSGILALLTVYVVWGSSFPAIRMAVTGDGAFASYTLAALRTTTAGLLLLLWALLRRDRLRVSAKDLRSLAFTGMLLWIGGHALVIWAQRTVDSGLAAMIFASSPLWSVAISAFGGALALKQVLPVLSGFAGIVLVFPMEKLALGHANPLDMAALLLAAFFWALGTVLSQRSAQGIPLLVANGYQLLAAGVGTSLIALFAGEGWPNPNPRALFSFAYLVSFCTVIAYLAYGHCMRVMPTSWVMSVSYVNPIVAVLLGMFLFGERLQSREVFGLLLVLASVIWLFAGNRTNKEA